MNKRYIEDISRLGCSFFDIKAWYEGESKELEKEIGFGFYNTIFEVNGGNVTLYYDERECENFYGVLGEKLTEDFFGGLCDNFFKLIEETKFVDSNEKIFELMVKCWPALVIFEELSNYPEYGTDFMIRRLIRVRKSTESFIYELSKRLKLEMQTPENYLFFKGEIINKPFEEFIMDQGIIILKNE